MIAPLPVAPARGVTCLNAEVVDQEVQGALESLEFQLGPQDLHVVLGDGFQLAGVGKIESLCSIIASRRTAGL